MALFKTTDEIKGLLPVNVTFNFEDILPFIDQVERDVIIPAISKTQYDNLSTAYNVATPALSAEQTSLLSYIRYALAPLAYKLWVPWGQVQISSAGIRIASTETNKTAFKWQIDDLKASAEKAGYSALEQLLIYMEENKANYALWTDSSSYTISKAFFINSAKDFNDYYDINSSRLLFMRLRASMKKAEDLFIKPVLCQELYDEIKAQVLAGTVSVNNAKLLPFIHPAIAHLTIYKALLERSVVISGDGVLIINYIAVEGPGSNPAETQRLEAMMRIAHQDGMDYLKQLRNYLNNNATASVYPLYFASDQYLDPEGSGTDQVENQDEWGAVSV